MVGEYFIKIKEQEVGVLFTSHLFAIMADNSLNDKMTLSMNNLIATAREKQGKGLDSSVENQKIGGLAMAMHCNNTYMGYLAWCDLQEDVKGNFDYPKFDYLDFQEWCAMDENKEMFFHLIKQYTKLNSGKPVEKAKEEPIKKKKKKSLLKKIFGRLKNS